MAQGGSDVAVAVGAQDADGEVAQTGHGAWCSAGADLGGVLGEGDIAEVMHRLDGPVPPDEIGQPGGAGLGEAEAGDRVDGYRPPSLGPEGPGLAGDLEDLSGVGEAEVADGDDLEGAMLDAAVAAVAGGIRYRDQVPGQALAAGQQGGLVGLNREQVVGLLVGDQELGGVGVGVERVLCRGGCYAEVVVMPRWRLVGGGAAVGGDRAGEVGIITGFRGRR
jgi:hypothetical protein